MEDLIDVKSIEVAPNNCPLDSPLHLNLSIVPLKEITDAQWHVKYIVDFANGRQVIPVGVSPMISRYEPGKLQMFEFDAPQINVSAVPPVLLNNAGLLVLTLTRGAQQPEEIFQLSMVVQIEKSKSGETGEAVFIRTVLSPLE